MKLLQKTLILLIFSIFSFSACTETKESTLESYVKLHQDEYNDALSLSKYCEILLKQAGFTNEKFAISIVFPEMMRYSELQDVIESKTTELMYTLGNDSLTCSIGPFQMKPSFASHMEMIIAKDEALRKKYSKINFRGKDDTRDARYERIRRLKDVNYQILYLEAFIDACTKKYNLSQKSDEYKIQIIATAYNTGFSHTIEQLESISKIKAYPEGSNNRHSNWIYWELSRDFYNFHH